MLKHVRNGVGGLSVYVGLKGTKQELNLNAKHYWAFWTEKGNEDLDKVCEDYTLRSSDSISKDGPVPLLFISFPSAKDPLWEQKHPGTICNNCNNWSKVFHLLLYDSSLGSLNKSLTKL